MKRKTQLFLESMNSVLNEKINKDNIEINKAIANPNLGKNKEKIKAAGYALNTTNDGKVFGVNNPKTGKFINPSGYTKDEKNKVDFKGKLDSTRQTSKTSRYNTDVNQDRIPKSLKVNKDKLGNSVYQRDDELNSYSPSFINDKKHSISKNINDYNKAVKTRDEERNHANSSKEDLGYYERKVKDAQDTLDRQKKYISNAEQKSKDAEEKRKEILNRARSKNTNESSLTENEEDSYNAYKKVVEAIDLAITPLNDEDIQELLQNVIGICRDMAEDRGLMVESNLTEAGLANLKTIDDFDDIDDFNDALEDDKNTISNTLEDLKPKMNLKGSVDLINSFKDQMIKQIKSYND